MRVTADYPARRARDSNRGRVVLVVGLVLLFFLATSLRGIAGFWTDFLWFDSLGLGDVFSGILGAQLTLVLAFSLLFFLLLFVNLTIADRVAPKFRNSGPEELVLERYREVMGRRAGLVRAGVAAVFALLFGASAGAEWDSWLLFSHAQDFGVDDPEFGNDIGFYVFRLPFLSFVVEWLFVSLVIVLCITAVAHYLNGGIRMQSPFQRVTPQVKTHLSVLLALAAFVKAFDYWLQRYELLFSNRSVIDGAGYTDLNAQLPAINLLLVISLAACVLFIVNIWRRGWVLPAVAVGLWAFAQVVVGTAYPLFVQRFVVQPEESAKEEPYIVRNIEATRAALGLDEENLTVESFELDDDLSAEDLAANASTLRNIRLLDPAVVGDAFQRLEAGRGFYQFTDLDVDRYEIDGETTQVLVGTRELNLSGIPVDSWEGQHVTYTHGYGLSLAPTSDVPPSGEPEFLVRDLPVVVEEGVPIDLDQPQLYVGDGLGGYAVVGTDGQEIDYVDEQGTEQYRDYEGAGGVAASGDGFAGFMRRAAFALRFGEIDPLISNFIRSDSRMIYVRDVRERVQKVAPFFSYDADPYPVVIDGRVKYVLDGYATTSLYPYAEQVTNVGLDPDSGLNHSFNYVRNSVKAVVDSYDGTVTLYVVDDQDPITRAYREAFPDLFADYEDLPDGLADHLRYPDDLFMVQTRMWGRYHIDDPANFYSQSDGWEVAQDPGTAVPEPSLGSATGGAGNTPVTNEQGQTVAERERRIPPYFLQMHLPGEETDDFVSLRPFVRASQQDEQKVLTSFMVAKSDPGRYGELVVYDLDQAVDGPSLVADNINSTPEVGREISLLDQQGSRVEFGNLLLVPIEDTILYVRPLYVKSSGETQVPKLRSVILSLGPKVVIEDTLAGALAALFEDEEGQPIDDDAAEAIDTIEQILGDEVEIVEPSEDGSEDGSEGGEPEEVATIEELLAEADELFAEADAALAEGDLGGYQDKVDEAQAKVADALELAERAVGTAPADGESSSESGSDAGSGPGGGDAAQDPDADANVSEDEDATGGGTTTVPDGEPDGGASEPPGAEPPTTVTVGASVNDP